MMKKIAVQNNGKTRLEIQKTDLQSAWKISQNYSHTLAKHNAYLNHVCSTTFSSWWEHQIKSSTKSIKNLNSEETSHIWEFVNGVALQMGKTRLVLIPENEHDTQEFRVPQEWIDIPSWTADYYLDVRVNLDADDNACWMEFFGFTTHRQLKIQGTYHSGDRTYSVPVNSLIDELNVMAMTLNLNVQAEVLPLPAMSTGEAESLIEELGKPALYSPRLRTDIPFEKWAVLLDNEAYRQQLFNLRMGKVVANAEMKKPTVTTPSNSDIESNQKYITLTRWLQQLKEDRQNITEGIWQLSERIVGLSKTLEPMYTRSGSTTVQHEKAITAAIRRLTPTERSDRQQQALRDLGEMAKGHLLATEAIQQFIQLPDIDSDTRLIARLNLGKIDPTNPLAATERSRLVDLGMQLGNNKVKLIIAIMQKDDTKMNIIVRVQPMSDFNKLPTGLTLSILDKPGETVPDLEVTARGNSDDRGIDDFLRLIFSLSIGKFFKVRLSLDRASIIEDFIV